MTTSPMKREYEACQVCQQRSKLGIDINQQNPFAQALRDWGEELAVLRLSTLQRERPARRHEAV
jgi:hypothetical protein